jgi:ZIP family zinc transporter
MLAVSLVHIFPEALERTPYAVYAFLAGYIAIYLVEELLTPHRHDHAHGDHTHEDPHEHYDHIAIVSCIAICVHTLIDGVGIRAGMGLSPTIGYAILLGVAIHQIPVSLALAALLSTSGLSQYVRILCICLFAVSAPIGFIVSDILLTGVSETIVGMAAAFAGGSLLYIATTDLIPMIHSISRNKYISILAFLVGVCTMTLLATHTHTEHSSTEYVHGHIEG